MNDRVLKYQAAFFSNEKDAIEFWNAMSQVLSRRDYQINKYITANDELGVSGPTFHIARLCHSYVNIISISEYQNYFWVGILPNLCVAGLYKWILAKASGDDSDNSNRFVLLGSFLKFNFNRRSTNAMLNGLFAFMYPFKDELISYIDPKLILGSKITDHVILDSCMGLLKFTIYEILPQVFSEQAIKNMVETACSAFPYIYVFKVDKSACVDEMSVQIPDMITITSYTPIPEHIAYMSIHREVSHIVCDFLGRDETGVFLDQFSNDMTAYDSFDAKGESLCSVKFHLCHDVNIQIIPCELGMITPNHRCYLFDGLDVLSSIDLRVSKDPLGSNVLKVDLKLLPSRSIKGVSAIGAYMLGRIIEDGFECDRFRVFDDENKWVLYAAEIEALLVLYINDLIDNEGADFMNDVYDSIYISERNIIQSRAEILSPDP